MTKNMGSADRLVRVVLGLVGGYAYYSGMVEGMVGIAIAILAAVFIVTSAIGYCPLYTLFGIKTCKTEASTS